MPRISSKILALLFGLLLIAAIGCSSDARPTVASNPTSTPRPTVEPTLAPTATMAPSATATPTPVPTATPTATPTPVVPNAAFLAQLDLAGRLNIGPNAISVTGYEEASWPSSAYGCPLPGTIYLPVLVSGWNVSLSQAGKNYEYHTNESGDIQVNCTENRELERQTINVVGLANLRTATSIEMRRRDATGEFVLKSTVTDAGEITAIVDTLDVPVLRGPAASCTEVFRLVFITPSGDQAIGAICGGNSQLIRGEQPFWSGQDAEAPPEFSTLIGPYFSDEPIPTLPS